MDNAVGVLVANRPRLLQEMVMSALAEQEGFNVVGEANAKFTRRRWKRAKKGCWK
jgi:hypothetical protein